MFLQTLISRKVRLICLQVCVSGSFVIFQFHMSVYTWYTVYVPIEAQYPIEARPPLREQKLHANVFICNKMESLSNQNDI